MKRSVLTSAATAAAGILLLAGCSSTVDSDDVERSVSDSLEEQVGVAPDEVDCPDDLDAEEGATMTCTLEADDVEYDVEVEVTSVDGSDVEYDVQVADQPNN